MTRLRVGVIGLGAFGEAHLNTFRGIPGVEVIAVASRSGDRAREIATRYGIAHAFDSYDAICTSPDIDAVTVATEEAAHVAPTLAALATGKHVLLEKPLATTGEDALTIAEAAAHSSGRLLPGHIVRFEPRYAHLHDLMQAGSLGAIAALHASRNRPRSTRAIYDRSHPALVTAIHDLDVMLWLTGEMPERIEAWHHLDPDAEGVYGIWGVLHFSGGTIATIEATWMMPSDTGTQNGDTFAVVGTRGTANIDMGSSGVRILTTGHTSIPDIGYEPHLHGATGGALHAELSHFVQIATDPDRSAVVTPTDGVRAVLVAEAMIAAANTGQAIEPSWPMSVLSPTRT